MTNTPYVQTRVTNLEGPPQSRRNLTCHVDPEGSCLTLDQC